MSSVPLPLVRQFLNLTTTDQDDEVLDMIDRAEAILAARLGPLEPTTVTETHSGSGPFVLNRRPVISVETIDGAAVSGTTVVDASAGVVYGDFSRNDTRRTEVSYTTGWETLPADLEAAVLELVGHLWESQRMPMHGRPGFTDSDVNPEVGIGSKYLLPYRVQTLIEPYVRSSGLA